MICSVMFKHRGRNRRDRIPRGNVRSTPANISFVGVISNELMKVVACREHAAAFQMQACHRPVLTSANVLWLAIHATGDMKAKPATPQTIVREMVASSDMSFTSCLTGSIVEVVALILY